MIDIAEIPQSYLVCSCRSNCRMGPDLAYYHDSKCPNFRIELELVILANRYLQDNQKRLQMQFVIDRLNQDQIRDHAIQTADASHLDQREREIVQSAIDAFSQAAWGGATVQTEDGENLLLMSDDCKLLAEVLSCVAL